MEQIITPEEREIMRNAYVFLSTHCNPPANHDECACDWWLETVQEMGQVCAAWNNHPLVIEILIALCNYIEGKAKKENGGSRSCIETANTMPTLLPAGH